MTKDSTPAVLGLSDQLGPLPEPRDLDGARWGYDADDMHSYAVDAFAAGVAAERSKWRVACETIARDLRNHEMVRLGAAKCMDAGLRA